MELIIQRLMIILREARDLILIFLRIELAKT